MRITEREVLQKRTHNRKLLELAGRQKREVALRQGEMNRIKKMHQLKKDDTVLKLDQKLAEFQSKRANELLENTGKESGKTSKYGKSIEKAQKHLANEKMRLTKENRSLTETQSLKNQQRLHELGADFAKRLKEVSDHGSSSLERLKQETNEQFKNTTSKSQMAVAKNYLEAHANTINSTKTYAMKRDGQKDLFANQLMRQKKEHQDYMTKLARKNTIIEKQQESMHKKELENSNKKKAYIMNKQRAAASNIINSEIKSHQIALDQIRERFKSEMENIVKKNSEYKKTIIKKSEDPFYNVRKIDPKIENREKEYIISIEIPEHEKDLVQINPQGRNIRVSLARRFSDKYKTADGTINKSSRSENISKEFQVKDILDHKKITQRYDNGILQFKVAKK